MEYIKIHGAPRSGTNNLKYLLNANFKDTHAFMDIGGFRQWPHPVEIDWTGRDWSLQQRKPRKKRVVNNLLSVTDKDIKNAFAAGAINYIVISRHPYSAYLSRIRKRYTGKEYKQALNQPVGVFWFTLYWNAMYWNWYQQVLKHKAKSIHVKHEDIVHHFKPTLLKIQKSFSLQSKNEHFVKSDKKFHPSGLDSMSVPKLEDVNYDSNYDDKKFIMNTLGPKVIEEFKRYCDDELMEILGYKIW